MDIKSIFTDSFVDTIKTQLEDVTKDNASISRTKLCEQLDLSTDFAPIIAFLISANIIEGYDMRRGQGITKAGQKTADTPKKEKKSNKLTEEYLNELMETMTSLCSEYDYVPKKSVAEAMGDTSYRSLAMITAAMQLPEFSEVFESTRGPGRGISLIENRATKQPEPMIIEPKNEDTLEDVDSEEDEQLDAKSDTEDDIQSADTDEIVPDIIVEDTNDELSCDSEEGVSESSDDPDFDILDQVESMMADSIEEDDDEECFFTEADTSKVEEVENSTSLPFNHSSPLARHHAFLREQRMANENKSSD